MCRGESILVCYVPNLAMGSLRTSPASSCPSIHSVSSSWSCCSWTLVRTPIRLILGARVGVKSSEEITWGRFGSGDLGLGVARRHRVGFWEILLDLLLSRDLLRYSLPGRRSID